MSFRFRRFSPTILSIYYKEALKQKIAHLGERLFLFIFFYSAAVVSSAADSSPSDSSPSAAVSSAADSSSLGS